MRAADVAVALAALYWALPLTHSVGGRDVGKEGVLAGLLLGCVALVRPWRRLPAVAVAVPVWLGAAALVIPVVAPTGWRGTDDAAGYGCACLAFLVVAGWAVTPARRAAVAGGLGLAGLDQLAHALLPWWGGGNPAAELTGTFYWHNPFAAYLLPPAVLGAALVGWRPRPWHLVGWVAVPLSVAGIVLSSSRATLVVTALAIGGVALYAARVPGRRRLLPRLAAVVVVAITVTEVLPGPPLFSHRASPFASTAVRSAGGETLAANGGYRLEFWRSALANVLHHPVVGTGYHGLIEASLAYTPAGWARSNYAHDGYLQALSDGGLVLGLPLLLGCVLLALLAGRTLWDAVRTGTPEPLVVAAALGLLAALAHSGVDFDWSHSSLFVMDAAIAGLLVAGARRGREPRPADFATGGPSRALRTIGATGMLVLACLTAATGALGWRDRAAALTYGSPASSAAAYAAVDARPLVTDVAARQLLELSLDQPATVSRAHLETALAVTSRESTIDLALAAIRARVAIGLGNTAAAAPVIARLERVVGGRDAYAVDLAPLLAAAGQPDAARGLLRPRLAAALAVPSEGTFPLARAWAAISPAGEPTAACILAAAERSGQPAPDCPALLRAALAP